MVKSAFILSDIHLGASNSILTAFDYDATTEQTNERPFANAVLDKLLADLKAVRPNGPFEQCILLGDIFDLSFAPYGVTMQNGKWFFHKLVESGLFESFIYIPGNHDHHLWQQVCEHYYLMNHIDNPPMVYPRTLAPDVLLSHTFLDKLLPTGYSFQITYPNYHFSVADKPFYLHHGHYLQHLYVAASKFLSEVLQTTSIDDLETLNAPFLEFGWYNLGQAYNVGHRKLIDHIYFIYKNNRTDQIDQLIKLGLKKMNRLSRNPADKGWHPIDRFLDYINQLLGVFFIHRLFFKHSRRYKEISPASTARHKLLTEGLRLSIGDYMSQYLLPKDTTFEECSFVFGHTHEPDYDVLLDLPGKPKIHLYNTGGWVVDRVDEAGNWLLPQAAPLCIFEDASVEAIPFTQNHEQFLKTHLNTDPAFQALKQQ